MSTNTDIMQSCLEVTSTNVISESLPDTKTNNEQEALSNLENALKNYQSYKKLLPPKPYRLLNEFTNFQSVEGCTTKVFGALLNHVQTAIERKATREFNPNFLGNQYHIALRHGEYHAQKEKAMSKIFKTFLGQSTDVDIVQDGDKFYIASRTIKDFIQNILTDYTVVQDGRCLSKNSSGKIYKLVGLGSIAALDFFFGSDDVHSGNWGLQLQGDTLFAYRIDSPDILDIELLKLPITRKKIDSLPFVKREAGDPSSENDDIYSMDIPKKVAESKAYREEVNTMLKKLAETEFAVIKKILEDNIDTSEMDETFWTYSWLLPLLRKSPEELSKTDGVTESLEMYKEFIDSTLKTLPESQKEFQTKKSDLSDIFYLLESRHKQLRLIFGIETQQKPNTIIFSGNLARVERTASDSNSNNAFLSSHESATELSAVPSAVVPTTNTLNDTGMNSNKAGSS